MNWTSIIVGALVLAYGIYSIFARMKTPEIFAKLEPMKQNFGPRLGTAVHFVSYTLIPIAYGISMIFAGSKSISLFGK